MVATGLVMFGAAFAWVSTASVDTPYTTTIVPQMVLIGLGMGLTTTPATESIMLVLPPARAGVGSAVNDATREVGATLGVAIVGSLFSSVYAARLADSAFATAGPGQLEQAQDSVAVATSVGAADPALLAAAQESFLAGLEAGCLLVAGICLAGAVAAAVALPGRHFTPRDAATSEPEPASAAA